MTFCVKPALAKSATMRRCSSSATKGGLPPFRLLSGSAGTRLAHHVEMCARAVDETTRALAGRPCGKPG